MATSPINVQGIICKVLDFLGKHVDEDYHEEWTRGGHWGGKGEHCSQSCGCCRAKFETFGICEACSAMLELSAVNPRFRDAVYAYPGK